MITLPSPLVSVIVPVFREASNLEPLVTAIRKELDAAGVSYELIFVDDGSPDDTWDVIEQLQHDQPMIRAVGLSRNFGKERALCAGLEQARGKAVITMDGDLQHPPALIPEMLKIWRESKVDVVEAVKKDRGREPLINAAGAKTFYTVLSRLSGYDLEGATDYKLMDRRVVAAWLAMGERSLFFRGMIAWLGFTRAQIPFSVPSRQRGLSGWSFLRLTRLAINTVTAFSSIPLHLITVAGVGFFVFAVLLGAQTLLYKWTGEAVSGFTTVILLLLIIGSALMVGLGIIGEYLSRIYEEVKARPRYVVARTINCSEPAELTNELFLTRSA